MSWLPVISTSVDSRRSEHDGEIDLSPELELETRTRTDPRLQAAGSNVSAFVPGKSLSDYGDRPAVHEFKTSPGAADYALVYALQVFVVVEAKQLIVVSRGVLTQSERYSRRVAPGAPQKTR